MKNKKRLELALWAKDYAIKSGADAAAVTISNQRDVELEYREKQLDKIKESTQNSLSLRVYTMNRYSGHNTNDLRKEGLKGFISEAVAATKYLSEDKFRTLPDPEYYPKDMKRDLEIRDSKYESVNSDKRIQFASEIEEAANTVSDKIISTTAGYSDSRYNTVRVHSNGFQGESEGTVFSTGAEVTVNDPSGGRPSDWYYGTTCYFNELPDPAVLGKKAAKRALRKIGQKKIASGKYNMLVENRSCSRLLSVIMQAMSGRYIQQKRSFLDGKLDTQIASDLLTMTDDPFLKKGLGSRHYDGEGLASKRRVLIDKGILKSYNIDYYYGKKLERKPTSGSIANLILATGKHSLEEMIADMDKGILITSFIGGNANSTTGDFSYGIVGQLVENGKVVQPLNEMNISGNAMELWNRLAAVGNDPYPFSSRKMPSLLFEDVEFSGI